MARHTGGGHRIGAVKGKNAPPKYVLGRPEMSDLRAALAACLNVLEGGATSDAIAAREHAISRARAALATPAEGAGE